MSTEINRDVDGKIVDVFAGSKKDRRSRALSRDDRYSGRRETTAVTRFNA